MFADNVPYIGACKQGVLAAIIVVAGRLMWQGHLSWSYTQSCSLYALCGPVRLRAGARVTWLSGWIDDAAEQLMKREALTRTRPRSLAVSDA